MITDVQCQSTSALLKQMSDQIHDYSKKKRSLEHTCTDNWNYEVIFKKITHNPTSLGWPWGDLCSWLGDKIQFRTSILTFLGSVNSLAHNCMCWTKRGRRSRTTPAMPPFPGSSLLPLVRLSPLCELLLFAPQPPSCPDITAATRMRRIRSRQWSHAFWGQDARLGWRVFCNRARMHFSILKCFVTEFTCISAS